MEFIPDKLLKKQRSWEEKFSSKLKVHYIPTEENPRRAFSTLLVPDKKSLENQMFIIIVDDESIIRNAMKKIITSILKKNKIEGVIIEAVDGIECLFALYMANLNQIKIEFIISDENMNYLSGVESFTIISRLIKENKLISVPLFLSTSYDSNSQEKNLMKGLVKKVFSKPINKQNIEDIFRICNFLK